MHFIERLLCVCESSRGTLGALLTKPPHLMRGVDKDPDSCKLGQGNCEAGYKGAESMARI